MREPTPEQLHDACMTMRHDFGLMGPVERSKLQGEAMNWLSAWHGALYAEKDAAAEFINQISEILVGYREGREPDLLDKAKALMEISKQHQRQEQIAALFEAVRDLNAVADDIEADA